MPIQSLTDEVVKRMAQLAKLSLTVDQVTTFKGQFQGILGYMDMMNMVDTTSVSPTTQVTGLKNILREDVTQASLPQETVTALAPHHEDGYIKVPGVFGDSAFDK